MTAEKRAIEDIIINSLRKAIFQELREVGMC